MPCHTFEAIDSLIKPGAGRDWLDSAYKKLESSEDLLNELAILNAMARRKMDHGKIAESRYFLDTSHGSMDISLWEKGDAARVLLILKAIDLDTTGSIQLVKDLYNLSDENEKAAIVRGLILFNETDALKSIALEAGRTNSIVLFESLATLNPYPAAYYTEAEFNQLVLKALFVGVNICNVYGLAERANPELSRMCEDYVEERVLADRSVPSDIWLALGPHASPEAETLMIEYCAHPEKAHRYYAILALNGRTEQNPELKNIIDSRLAEEPDIALAARIKNQLN
jgi:hypothetical protein